MRTAKEPSLESGRVRLIVLFVVYLALLTWVVLWKLEVPWIGMSSQRVINLTPFAYGLEGTPASTAEVIGNLLLFVPFGIFLGLLAPSWSWWKVAGTVGCASLFFEITQYVLAVGSSDITDVIVNTAGGLAGFGILVVARRILRNRTVTVMTRILVIGTALAVLASIIFFVSPLRYTQPDVYITPGSVE